MSYAQQSDIEAVFGPNNVAAWSRFDPAAPSGPADANRITAALAFADSEINSFFAQGPYVLPLVCATGAAALAHWAGVIAGIWLYGSRVSSSYIDYQGNRFLAMREMIYADMHLYKAGVKRLDAVMRFPHATAPG